MVSEVTVMRVYRSTLVLLRSKKIHPRETDDDVLRRLLSGRGIEDER